MTSVDVFLVCEFVGGRMNKYGSDLPGRIFPGWIRWVMPRWIWPNEPFDITRSEILSYTKNMVVVKHRLLASDLYDYEINCKSGLGYICSNILNENFISSRCPVASFALKIGRNDDASEIIFTHLLVSGKDRIQSTAEFLAETGAILPGSALIVDEKGEDGFTCGFGRISSKVDDALPRRVSDVYPDVRLIDIEK